MINKPLTRRSTLGALVKAGAAAFFIPAWNETVEAADVVTCVAATPTVTEGPYWVDEKLFRSDVRTDPSTGVARAGIPLTLTITIQNLSIGSCTPLAGAYIDIWHCDAKGIYSDETGYNPGGGTGPVSTSGQKFLRGYQITDTSGQVTFTTIYPGWYSGRTIHIHFRVRTYSGTNVIGNFVSQIFFDDAINNAVLAQASYSRTTSRDTLNSNDMVYQVTNKERMLATVSGNAANGYMAAITAGVTLAVPALSTPAITTGGVGNSVSGAAGIASGSWVSIYGTNFATAAKSVASTDLVNNTLPTSLNGVSAQINGKAAFLQYVGPTQINALAPADTGTGMVAVSVTNAAGNSNSVSAALQATLPGLSVLSGYVRAVRYPDGAIVNGTGAAETGYTTSAAIGPGDILALYGTGFGPTTSTIATGVIFTGAYLTTNTVTVTIGGVTADVLWAGLVGPGLYQINIRVPATLADGDQVVVASVSGLSTQSGAKVKVAATAKLANSGAIAGKLHRGLPPSVAFAQSSLERLLWLGGLHGPAQHEEGGSALARVSRQAAEQQGGLVWLG